MLTGPAGSVGWRLQNERMQQTKSTPRLTAEVVAFAADPRCWPTLEERAR